MTVEQDTEPPDLATRLALRKSQNDHRWLLVVIVLTLVALLGVGSSLFIAWQSRQNTVRYASRIDQLSAENEDQSEQLTDLTNQNQELTKQVSVLTTRPSKVIAYLDCSVGLQLDQFDALLKVFLTDELTPADLAELARNRELLEVARAVDPSDPDATFPSCKEPVP